MGVSAARRCAQLLHRQGRVALIDQFDTSTHNRGSSHGDGRIFRFAYPDKLYVEMAQRSWVGWQELQDEHKPQLYSQCGGIDIGVIDGNALTSLKDTFRECNVSYDVLDAAETLKHFPQFNVSSNMHAIHQRDAAALFADPCREAFTKSGKDRGVEVFCNTKAVSIDASGRDVVVQLNPEQKVTAHRVIVAAGSWTNKLLSSVGVQIPYEVTEEVVCYYKPKTNIENPVDHTHRSMPIFIYHAESDENVEHFYGLPQIAIPGIKAATHFAGPRVDPDQRPHNHPRHVELVKRTNRFVESMFPHVHHGAFQQVRCLYSTTPDHDFVLDRLQHHPNISVAAGFSGHGFKFAPIIGEVVAQLALDEPTTVPLDKFSLSRFDDPSRIRRALW